MPANVQRVSWAEGLLHGLATVQSASQHSCILQRLVVGVRMCAVPSARCQLLQVVVRGKVNDAVVTKMPFVPNTYYKEPAAKSEN